MGALEKPYPVSPAARRAIGGAILQIQDRLDDEWTLERMAVLAGYEPHHYAHAFSAVVGTAPVEYLRSLRLERAAHDLMYAPEKSLGAIATEAGYASVSAFRRAFTRAFDSAPTALRTRKEAARLAPRPRTARRNGEVQELPTGLVEEPGFVKLGALETQSLLSRAFDDAAIEEAWRAFWPHAWPADRWTIGAATPPWGFITESRARQYRCLKIVPAKSPAPPAPLERWTIAARWYARFLYRGPMATMHDFYRWIFGAWLPESGLRYSFAPVVTLFDAATWLETGFTEAHARVHVPIASVRLSASEPRTKG